VAGAHERPPTSKRDLTLVLSAVGAIFAGLIGTNVLDAGNSARWMGKIDHAAVVLWLPALLLLALCAYKSPTENKWLREGAWAATALAGLVTAVVLLFTGFGFHARHRPRQAPAEQDRDEEPADAVRCACRPH
jgi:hypothetical protein